MIVLDTSGLLSAIDATQRQHEVCKRILSEDPGPFVLSPFVLEELDYLLASHVGVEAQVGVLTEVAVGAYSLAPFAPDDVQACAELLNRYRDLGIGLADASLVVLAQRHRTTRILTLDERHFRAVRPLYGRSFKLLPADA